MTDHFSLPKDRCPKCGSRNICVGAFPLSCQDCGWNYLNENPCSTCGAPSFSVIHSCGVTVYACKDHPISEEMRRIMWARFALELKDPKYHYDAGDAKGGR